MRILGVDTASRSASVAVVEEAELLSEITVCTGETHTRHLMEMIRTALDISGTPVETLDGIAVTRGPGSFTGLRIGLATVKGLAEASGKPVAGVESLEALALAAACPGLLVLPLLDARRGEVYCRPYRLSENGLEARGPARVLPPEKALLGIDEPCLFVGDGAVLYRAMITQALGGLARFAHRTADRIRASAVAWLGMERLRRGEEDDLIGLAPDYMRKSEAEIKRASEPLFH